MTVSEYIERLALEIHALDEHSETYACDERLEQATAFAQAAFVRWYWTADGYPREERARDRITCEILNADLRADGISWQLPVISR